MSEEPSFLRALQEEPDDDDTRLVYADWLEERRDPRGEYLRLTCRVLQDLRRLRELRPGIAPDWLQQVDRAPQVREQVRLLLGHPTRQGDWYRTASGREVLLDQFHVQRFDLGCEGHPDRVRAGVLERLPERARQIYPSNNGLFIKEAPRGMQGSYPRFIFFAELLSTEPVHNSQNQCSSLIVVWFGDHIDLSLDEWIAENLRDVVWEDHAVDGDY